MLLGLLLSERSRDCFTTVRVSLDGILSWGSIGPACVSKSPGSSHVIDFPRQNERQIPEIDFMVLKFWKPCWLNAPYVWCIAHGRDSNCGVHADYIRKSY